MLEENFIVCCVWELRICCVERLFTRKDLDFVRRLEVALIKRMLKREKEINLFRVFRGRGQVGQQQNDTNVPKLKQEKYLLQNRNG